MWRHRACCAAAPWAVLLGTARNGANTASPTAAQRVLVREAFSCRLPSKALLRDPTKGWHVTVSFEADLVSLFCVSFSEWGETESTWYVGLQLAYCTTPEWWMMINMEQSVEWGLAGETEVLGENMPQCHFVNHKSHMTWIGLESGPPRWKAGDQQPELWHGPKQT
jgi:hypothetical protein